MKARLAAQHLVLHIAGRLAAPVGAEAAVKNALLKVFDKGVHAMERALQDRLHARIKELRASRSDWLGDEAVDQARIHTRIELLQSLLEELPHLAHRVEKQPDDVLCPFCGCRHL